MQSKGEADADTCAYNDLALVKVDPADVGNVNPSIPFWAGRPACTAAAPPPATRSSATATRAARRRRRSSAQAGQERRRRRKRLEPHGLHGHPGIPATPGSAFLDATGNALGVLSTVAIAPLAGSNGVGDVAKGLADANSTGGFGVTLAQGTEAFTGPLLPI